MGHINGKTTEGKLKNQSPMNVEQCNGLIVGIQWWCDKKHTQWTKRFALLDTVSIVYHIWDI